MKKLKYAYKIDQNHRKQPQSFAPYFGDLVQRDDKRLRLVTAINEDSIIKPIDKFYAAFI